MTAVEFPQDAKTQPILAAETLWGGPVLGVGVIALALVSLGFGRFDPGQAVPKPYADQAVLAYAAGGLMLAAGAATAWRRSAAWGAAALALYYGLFVVLLMNGRVILSHPAVYGVYSGAAEQTAIGLGALILWAGRAPIDPAFAARVTRIGQVAFGVCALLFGGAHFVYLSLTIPYVPRWLPPNAVFWAYATGVAHVAGGLALISGVRARLAAVLLTVMYAAFTPLVHLPMLITDPTSPFVWSENALNLALVGAAWVVSDSLARRRAPPVR